MLRKCGECENDFNHYRNNHIKKSDDEQVTDHQVSFDLHKDNFIKKTRDRLLHEILKGHEIDGSGKKSIGNSKQRLQT